ncbi:hypothetical protein CONPUDRAFT_85897, partial [Coniophora puteana RWD-64-598 SS2]
MIIVTKQEPFDMPGAFPTTDAAAIEDLPPPYSERDELSTEPGPSTSSLCLRTHLVEVHSYSGNAIESTQPPPRPASTPIARLPLLDTTSGPPVPAQHVTTPTHARGDFSLVDSQKPLPKLPLPGRRSRASTSSLPSVSSASTSQSRNPSTSQSWLRSPPSGLSYARFYRMVHHSKGEHLSGGFLKQPPNCSSRVHPFLTHNVDEEDWIRFLGDVERTASPPSQAMTLRSSGMLSSVLGASKAGNSSTSLPSEELASVRKTI